MGALFLSRRAAASAGAAAHGSAHGATERARAQDFEWNPQLAFYTRYTHGEVVVLTMRLLSTALALTKAIVEQMAQDEPDHIRDAPSHTSFLKRYSTQCLKALHQLLQEVWGGGGEGAEIPVGGDGSRGWC